jgi:acetyl-CoA C-acetyltransferase
VTIAARDTVICSPVRTAVGRFGGVFRDLSAQELGAAVVRGLLERTGVSPDAVDDVLFAQCYPSMDAPALGRVVALDAGLPVETGGLQIDRRCGSGLQAVIYGALQVATGASDVVIAGGAESMSNAPLFTHAGRWGLRGAGLMLHDALARGRVTAGGKNYPVPDGMVETAENLRREYAISRTEQDEFALRSHQRAVAAQKNGTFAEEIIPVTVPGRGGDTVVTADEHPRADTSLESLGRLRPMLGRKDPESTVTAGNASGQNDGASACLITTRENADALDLRPLARITSWAVAGVPPKVMGIGPVPSTTKALARAGLALSDIDLLELNEAFAAQALAVVKDWALDLTPGSADDERFNVHGSGISLGHPVGATGGRILATLLHELHRREARYGLETMCIGGGQGLTAIFERVAD